MPRDRRIVANPVLGLPAAVAAIEQLDNEQRAALAAVLKALRIEALDKAEECWRRHKGPMAAYWKACGVYSGHIARALAVAPCAADLFGARDVTPQAEKEIAGQG